MEKYNNNKPNDQNKFTNYNNYNNRQFIQEKNEAIQNQGYNRNISSQAQNFNPPYNSKLSNTPLAVNNIRNTEAPNMYYKNKSFQQTQDNKEISGITEFKRGEKPLWSYRETTYDEFKIPRNTETVTTNKINRKSNVAEQPFIPRKSNLEELQEMDKKYFNNVKYKKVKVTKKVKNGENKVQKKGPEDDYEQKYSLQNYDNNQNQYNNNGFESNNQNEYNYNNEENENENNNGYMMNDEQNNNNIQGLMEKFGNTDINKNESNDNENDEELQNMLNNNNINNNNIYKKQKSNNEDFQNNENELEKDNYELDLDQLEETNSLKNQQEEEKEEEEYTSQLKYNNDNEIDNNENIQENNDYENNNQVNPRPSFIETTTQKVTDNIDQIIMVPETNLEKWNLVADYIP